MTEVSQLSGVVYLKDTSENALNALLMKMEAEGLALVSVVPKIETRALGFPETTGLWLFWRK